MKMPMKFMRFQVLVLIVSALLLVSGCRTVPVRNVENSPVVTNSQAHPDMQKIGDAILNAGAGLGWRMTQVEAGQIKGSLYVRAHRADIEVVYNHKSYNIFYKDSSNLKYDATKATIHRQYNNWVKRLDDAIQRELVGIK